MKIFDKKALNLRRTIEVLKNFLIIQLARSSQKMKRTSMHISIMFSILLKYGKLI